MNVNIDLNEWKLRVNEAGEKKITGEFAVKVGATVLATQSFNTGGYNEKTIIPFSSRLCADIETLNDRILAEIRDNFIGKKGVELGSN